MSEPVAHSSETGSAQNAKLAYEQMLLVWQDEVAFADTLRDKRRIYSTGLVILAGLGVFRLAWTRPEADVPVVDSAVWRGVIKCAMGFALAMFIAGAYFLFTERPVVSFVLCRSWPWAGRKIGVLKRIVGFKDQIALPELGASMDVLGRGPARRALVIKRDKMSPLLKASLEEVWIYRESKLRLAYEKLAWANSRVNHRIEVAVLAMIGGYLVLGIAFGLYTYWV